MIDEIFEVMKHFPKSHINAYGELVLSSEGNVFFVIADCKSKEDIICELLERCSRQIVKPIKSVEWLCLEWVRSLLAGYNSYLGTHFTLDDMHWICDKLGNAVDHELTLKFIASGFDLSLVRPEEKSDGFPILTSVEVAADICKKYDNEYVDGNTALSIEYIFGRLIPLIEDSVKGEHMTFERLVVEAYRLIRQKARDLVNPVDDETLGAYVRGVVDLQTELWDAMQKEGVKNDN